MPEIRPQLSYPGVYVQEVESDVHTINAVETATTAFIGAALRGPVDDPVICTAYADFERAFGGLKNGLSLGYAVRDFFLNGGAKAVVVRVDSLTAGDAGAPARLSIDRGKKGVLTLTAKNPGAWGNSLRARVTPVDKGIPAEAEAVAELARRFGVAASELFNLEIRDGLTGQMETFLNLTTAPSMHMVDRVIAGGSELVTASVAPASRPATAPDTVYHADVETGRSWWEDPSAPAAPGPYTASDQGGRDGKVVVTDILGSLAGKRGLYALSRADIFNLLYIPGFESKPLNDAAAAYCQQRRAMLILDAPQAWGSLADARDAGIVAVVTPTENAMLYFPWIIKANPQRDHQMEAYGPGGTIAGVIASTDSNRGVWKAPAGQHANLLGVSDLSLKLNDAEQGQLNPLGINCLRSISGAGLVVWGARTTVGDDRLSSDWKYVPVRRTALMIEESLYRGTQWAIFEANDEPLWSQLRLKIGVFMHGLFVQGAFQGASPNEAYFVRCDGTTTTQADIDRGIVNVVVGFAPLKPAEFLVLHIAQIAGQLAV